MPHDSCFMAKKLTPAMQQYFDFKEQHKDAVLFFQLGDFYELFGEDAVEVSQLLDLTLTSRHKGAMNELPMCGVPIKSGPTYIARLTEMGKKVALCEQVSQPTGKGVVQREVTKIITPGTTFDDELLSGNRSNFLCAVHVDKDEYGFGFVDVTTGQFQVAKLQSKEQLLDEIHRLEPSEILMEEAHHESFAQLNEGSYLGEAGLPSWENPESLLTEHFQTVGLESFGLEEEPILQKVAAALLHYLKETQRSSLAHIRSIERYEIGATMLLDESTIRNLELFYQQQTGKTEGSFLSVIDRTSTAMGARLLRWWLAHPLCDKEKIEARLKAVQAMVAKKEAREQIATSLQALCDLERLVGKLGTLRVNPRDLFNIKEALKQLPLLKASIDLVQTESELLQSLNTQMPVQPELIELIETTLSDEPSVLLQDGGYIREGFNAELDELRTLSASGKEWLAEYQTKERERTGIASLKVKFNKVFGYYIEVSKSNLSAVPDDYHRKQTLVNAERFITPELKEYEEKILGAEEKSLQKELELFTVLRDEVFNSVEVLQTIARTIAQVDVLHGFAMLAVEKKFAQPILQDETMLTIKQGRHLVIEALSSEPYVPNDLLMDNETSFHLLTGPNMSGKSSFLRQNALIVLLAQIGSFVPATEMNWSVVDRIFTRVGASDNLARGRSTFMVEMQEASYILNHATEKSLVILDELGRGTSTYDGLSLAWAITEYLHDVTKSKTLFATHYHELIEIVEDLPQAKNYSVAVAKEGDDVVFLHKVLEGGIDQSYGIEVAKLAGLPHPLVLRARDLLARLESHAWENDQNRQKTLPLMPVAKQPDHPVVKTLKEVDPNQMTPVQALNKIIEWKREIEKDK